MARQFFSGKPAAQSTMSSLQIDPFALGTWTSTFPTNREIPILKASVVDNLSVKLASNVPVGCSVSYTVYKNSVATAVTFTINAGENAGNSGALSVAFAANDLLSIERNGSGAVGAIQELICWEIECDDPYSNVYGSGTTPFVGIPSDGRYNGIFTGNKVGWAAAATPANSYQSIVGAPGNLTSYRIIANGLGSSTLTFVIYKNDVAQDGSGGTPDTRLALTSANMAGATATFSLACAQDDRLYIGCSLTSGGAIQINLAIGFGYETTVAGQWNLSSIMTGNVGSTGVDYWTPFHGGSPGTEAPTQRLGPISPFTFEGFTWRLGNAPGTPASGQSHTLNIRVAGADVSGGPTVTISDDAVAGSTSTEWTTSGGELINWAETPSASPQPGAHMTSWMTLIGVAQAIPLQRVTQLVMLYGYNRYAEADPPPTEDACSGGGTVASGSNPTDGTSIATSSALHAVFRIAVNGTTYNLSKGALNYASPAQPRVDKFGRLRRALPDDGGGIELPSVWIDLFDYDNLLRGWHQNETLHGLTGKVLVADQSTWAAGGANAQVRFSGVVTKFEPLPGFRYRLTLKDPLAWALSGDGGNSGGGGVQETLLPRELIDVVDGTADQGLRRSPAPHLYGSLSEDGGCIELPFIGTETPIVDPTLGNRHRHLFGFGAIGNITAVFGADPLSGDPPTRRAALPASAYTSDFLAPHISGADWFLFPTLYSVDSGRWTFGYLDQSHPAANLSRYGRIPLTANLCGRETTGDGSGNTIEKAARQLLLVLNTAWANSVGDADHPAMATRDGFSIFNTQSFEAVQTVSENNSGISGGYVGAFVLGHSFRQITLREFLEQCYLSWFIEIYINRWGQVAAHMIDRTDDAAGVPHDRWDLHIEKGSFSIDPRAGSVENVTHYVYRRKYAKTLEQTAPSEGERLPSDAFQEDWLSGVQTITNSASVTALGGTPRGKRESRVIEMELTRHEETADDVAQQHNDLKAPANGRPVATYAIQLRRLDTAELGDLRKVTHPQGLGTNGWEEQRVELRAIEEDWNTMIAVLEVRDVDDLLAA